MKILSLLTCAMCLLTFTQNANAFQFGSKEKHKKVVEIYCKKKGVFKKSKRKLKGDPAKGAYCKAKGEKKNQKPKLRRVKR